MQQGRLPAPLLYLSSHLEDHPPEYHEPLQAVRERGELQEWIQFFLTAVAAQAEDAVARAEQLVDLRERYRLGVSGSRSRAVEVVDLIMENPIITASTIERRLAVTNQGPTTRSSSWSGVGSSNAWGGSGRGRRQFWLAREVFTVQNRPRA